MKARYLLLVLLAGAAAARPVVDQEAPYGTATIQVGGEPQNWVVAQTVTAGAELDAHQVAGDARGVPVCRCLSDEGLREFRCALMNPSYFAFRTIPSPLKVRQQFKVSWTLTLAAPMEGVIEVKDELPPEFGGAPKAPLTFFVSQVPPGQSITLTYDAVAPSKPGRYKVSTGIGEGAMQTFVEVLP